MTRPLVRFGTQIGQNSFFQSDAWLDRGIIRQRAIQLTVELIRRSIVIRLVALFHLTHLDSPPADCASFSFKICRARNTLDRTAASLIPNVAATSRGVISSTVERIRGSRSFAGNATISFSRSALTCRPCNVSSALESREATSGKG